ncbi:uncharacterized protein EDB93DRAFT_1104963 [Suillus bovinus]|uniref:uncharacterized protein n=1 Tax=Suillus bovinus TaxID=48563 RepID=UPI001B8618C3|nr:uncharacterized protein EDB93DRAFT_1104963 [Suillus bovinus]KAG2144398.1 hypothetical protein EDB93DRAFT_1104963 [Suillus bovinus]
MAQDNPHRKKRFTFFSKTHPEAHQSSDIPPPPSQSHRGSFASLRSKAKDLFPRPARRPNSSQLVSPSEDVRQDSAQLMVSEEVVDELPNTSSNHPSTSLEDPPYDDSHSDPTSDQHARQQSDKLPSTDQSTHKGQMAHGAESNDSATTDKPDLNKANEARKMRKRPFLRYGISSGSDDVNYLAVQIHPYAKAAWGVLSVVSKTITSQATRDDSISQLLSKMDEVYTFLHRE